MTQSKRVLIWCAVSSKVQAKDDKISLSLQERLGREFAASIGGSVVGVLTVPGHSRSDDDIVRMLEEHAAAGCFAYHDLRRLWYARGFDILWTHTDDRLARSTTGITYVMTNTIQNGMSIYLDQPKSWITRDDAKFKTLMSAMSAGESIQAFVTKSQATKDDNAARGIHSTGRLPFGLTRREGDCVTIPDERYRALFQDVATLLLERTDWDWFETKLHERFRHVNPNTGRVFAAKFWYVWFHNPWVWGHGARNWHGKEMAAYAYDESVPVPDGVKLWRHGTGENKAQPVYSGEQAALIQAELKRRLSTVPGGKARADRTKKFAGLIRCGQCGYNMISYSNKRDEVQPVYMVCRSGIAANRRDMPKCSHRHVRIDVVQAYVEALFRRIERDGDFSALELNRDNDLPAHRRALETEKVQLTAEIDRLANRLAAVDDDAVNAVQTQINRRAARRKAVESELQQVTLQLAAQDTRTRAGAWQDIQAAGTTFWQQPEPVINQLLLKLFGDVRMYSGVRQIDGLTSKPDKHEFHHRRKPQI